MPVPMEELHSLDPRRQELLEARFTGAVTGNTVGSTGSISGGAKVTTAQKKKKPSPHTNAVVPGAKESDELKVHYVLCFCPTDKRDEML